MNINITALLYLFLRLAPFILVSFFSLSSIFNHDFKGIVYLLGLLVSNVVVLSIESFMPVIFFTPPDAKDMTCDFLNISSGDSTMSNMPLGTGIIAYTLAYLLFVIIKYGYFFGNIGTIILLSTLLLSDFIWHIQHNCFRLNPILFTIFFFSVCGVGWAILIDGLKMTDLQYFTSPNGQEICSQPSRQSFTCRKKKMN
jgi:hypothetical protein